MTTSDTKLDRVLGAKTGKALESALGLSTVGDLLRNYPRRYAERGELTPISGLEIGEHATVLGLATAIPNLGEPVEVFAVPWQCHDSRKFPLPQCDAYGLIRAYWST